MVTEVYYEVHITRVLHASRISNFDSVMFVNRIREMVSFELDKETLTTFRSPASPDPMMPSLIEIRI